jgi:hypothetical protein
VDAVNDACSVRGDGWIESVAADAAGDDDADVDGVCVAAGLYPPLDIVADTEKRHKHKNENG